MPSPEEISLATILEQIKKMDSTMEEKLKAIEEKHNSSIQELKQSMESKNNLKDISSDTDKLTPSKQEDLQEISNKFANFRDTLWNLRNGLKGNSKFINFYANATKIAKVIHPDQHYKIKDLAKESFAKPEILNTAVSTFLIMSDISTNNKNINFLDELDTFSYDFVAEKLKDKKYLSKFNKEQNLLRFEYEMDLIDLDGNLKADMFMDEDIHTTEVEAPEEQLTENEKIWGTSAVKEMERLGVISQPNLGGN